jgi:hypothetical protein
MVICDNCFKHAYKTFFIDDVCNVIRIKFRPGSQLDQMQPAS